ncbi:NPCBM/NEW2 domain-containing protein [Streptomyces sp. NBC_01324]|uniref:NPCBM/NEW2 domain-containing protein n=1 Tax=Streptomyces sp. NBC_01324 TaxID=2903826 RepID=UPI002E15E686|nr:NPCBM/NEW2 domain-containing protein [Streptomyces sp. NBC_01324]
MTATHTVTVTATVTAPPPEGPTGATGQPSDTAAATPPAGDVSLNDLTPIGDYPSEDPQIRSVTMGGKSHTGAMVFPSPCARGYEYSINARYKELTFTAGLDDNGVAQPGKLSVLGDGKARKTVMLEINHPQTVTVDLTGVVKLIIEPDFDSDISCDGVIAAIADAVLRP